MTSYVYPYDKQPGGQGEKKVCQGIQYALRCMKGRSIYCINKIPHDTSLAHLNSNSLYAIILHVESTVYIHQTRKWQNICMARTHSPFQHHPQNNINTVF